MAKTKSKTQRKVAVSSSRLVRRQGTMVERRNNIIVEYDTTVIPPITRWIEYDTKNQPHLIRERRGFAV